MNRLALEFLQLPRCGYSPPQNIIMASDAQPAYAGPFPSHLTQEYLRKTLE
jgi:hypothetical protein